MRGANCLFAFIICIASLLALPATSFAQDSAAPQSPAAGEAAGALYDIYTIRRGDTLLNISQRFSTTIDKIQALNGIAEEGQLIEGQSILLPPVPQPYVSIYDVKAGDTLVHIAAQFESSYEVLQALNGIADRSHIEAGTRIVVPNKSRGRLELYRAEAGDTLQGIAGRYFTSALVLKSLNGIAGSESLEAGRSIVVPKADEARFAVYKIDSADSVQSIATQFASTEAALLALNSSADAHELAARREILVPRIDEELYDVYLVEAGDSLLNIARLYNSTVAQLRALNSIEEGLDIQSRRSILVPRLDEALLAKYVVQAGDSFYGIARRHGLSLSSLQALNKLEDLRDIRAGQALLVPKLEDAALAVHSVKPGDTLSKIAADYATTVAIVKALNGIGAAELLHIGDRIVVPQAREIKTRAGFGFGMVLFPDGAKAPELTQQIAELGANWVKVDVRWAEIEPRPGSFHYAELDAVLMELELAGLNILINVHDAPAWSRAGYLLALNSQLRQYSGPPDNYADFAAFLADMAARYAGVVDAYEIWKAPNLLQHWSAPVYQRAPEMTADGDYGIPDAIQIGAEFYLPLLRTAYETVKAIDENALILTAGLAPVGFTDGYNSIDTDTFLTDMLEAGAGAYSDGIGAVFGASAVPPSFSCCAKPPGVDSHYESFVQYFRDLLAYYDQTLRAAGVDMPIYITQAGWGTSEGGNLALPASGYEWLRYTSALEQALYTTQAYQIAQNMDSVAAMFLHNLNGCQAADAEACFFSLVDADGERRPAFAAYAALPKATE